MFSYCSSSDFTQVNPGYRTLRHLRARHARLLFHFDYCRTNGKLSGRQSILWRQWRDEFKKREKLLLDNLSLNYRAIGKWLRERGKVEQHCQSIFGVYIPRAMADTKRDIMIEGLYSYFRKMGNNARHNERVARLTIECQEALDRGEFLLFNTLTVAPDCFHKVFDRGSREFTDYYRRIERACPGARHFAVTERGAKTGRLHIHVLHFLPTLPGEASDPNRGRRTPDKRCIDHFRSYWSNGHSAPIAVRLAGRNDAFSKLGWAWPVEKQGNKYVPVKSRPMAAVVGYMTKYMLKANCHSMEAIQWRVKQTRSLGLKTLQLEISKLKIATLLQLIRIPWLPKTITRNQLGLNQLRKSALKELLKRSASRPKLMRLLNNRMVAHNVRGSLREQYENMIRMIRTSKWPKTTHTLFLKSSSALEGCSDAVNFYVDFCKRYIDNQPNYQIRGPRYA